jgi:hypothetical protein
MKTRMDDDDHDDDEDEMYASKKNHSSISSNNFDGVESDVLSYVLTLVIDPLFIYFFK